MSKVAKPHPLISGSTLMLLAAAFSAVASAQSPSPRGASSPGAPRAQNAPARAGRATPDPSTWVSVWVDMNLPELASLPPEQHAEREALRLAIQAQQEAAMDRLRGLGAIEQARVQLVRNALAVRLPGAQLDAARQIPGVRAVRIVRHVDTSPLVHGD